MYPAYLRRLAMAVALIVYGCGGGGGGGGSGVLAPSGSGAPRSIGSGTGALISPPVAAGNILPIVLDAGPVGTAGVINIPYVSVTVCTPGASGTTPACQTIDHVHMDTASFGLRLLRSALSSNLNLPAVTNAGGQAIGECQQFADGFTWGSVLLADVYLAGEVARSIPIQDIGDQPGGTAAIPADCANTGGINLTGNNTVAQLGANGILGIGLFKNDCDACLVHAIPATYYACTTAGCSGSTVTTAQVVKNPVAVFQQDNNGVVIDLPAVPNSGNASVSGSLIFGIGTQSNNVLGTAVVYSTDSAGNFTTSYTPVGSGAPITFTSFIDSGSNAVYFTDAGIPVCSLAQGFYCPPSPLSSSATNIAAGAGGANGVVNFSLVNVDLLADTIVAANIGGPTWTTLGNEFDWGLPFFFGRRVFTAIAGATTPGGAGPYWAY